LLKATTVKAESLLRDFIPTTFGFASLDQCLVVYSFMKICVSPTGML